jgi:hypothetical protein
MTPIAELESGARARVVGTIRRARGVLTSELAKKPCVYWDVRAGLLEAPTRSEALDFWLEDESGRVLIIAKDLKVEALGERREEILRVADADHANVERRIRELKELLKTVSGPRAGQLQRERKALAHSLTLLLAIRAHARRRVHRAGSLRDQERWIAEQAKKGDGDHRSVKLMVESWEVVLEEGQRVEIEGVAAIEPVPPGVGEGGGYRERPTCTVLRAPEGGELRITGVGASALPQATREGKWTDPVRVVREPSRVTFERAVIAGLVVLLAAALLLSWMSE